jgi:uracil-DNA glycosylase family 4
MSHPLSQLWTFPVVLSHIQLPGPSPGNRTPRTLELDTCQENWLNRQIPLVNPKVIVLLGKVATVQLLGEEGSLRDLHGQTVKHDGRLCLMTYHPAAAFRVPETRDSMKQDMLVLRRLLTEV